MSREREEDRERGKEREESLSSLYIYFSLFLSSIFLNIFIS